MHLPRLISYVAACGALAFVTGCGSNDEINLGTGGSSASSSASSSSSGDSSSSSSGSGSSSSSSGGVVEKFSFFVTSLNAMVELSGNPKGFGGDLRYGETGPGAGLRGADKICAAIAEKSMPGAGSKPWRAFLSVSADENGNPVNARDRIGNGPWYDRIGRVVSDTTTNLINQRPLGGDAAIANDLPNEDGVPNHRPDPNQPAVDNHDTLTGSTGQGTLYAATATCLDWTSAAGNLTTEGKPRIGHMWPRMGGPGGGTHWIMSHEAGGCAPGVNLTDSGGPAPGDFSVGAGGGYGAIYCFSTVP